MSFSKNSELVNNLKFFSKIVSTIIAFEGFLGLLSFITKSGSANESFKILIPVNAGVSFCLLVCGMSLWFLQNQNKKQLLLGKFLALILVFYGFVINFVYFFNGNLLPYSVYLMKPDVALIFLITGLALLLIDFKAKSGNKPGDLLSLVIIFVSLLPYIGYAYGASSLYFVRIDTNLSVIFALMGCGIFFSRPQEGIMSLVTSSYAGGYMLRRLLLTFFGVSVLLGILRFAGQQTSIFGIQLGMFFVITICIIVFGFLILVTTKSLDLVDSKRKEAEQEIKELYTNLERMVQERTKQLDDTNKRLKVAMEALKHRAEELSRSNKEAEQFAYIASHDLQQPLDLVIGYARLLEKRYKDRFDQNANDYISTIIGSTDRMKKLISDLLKYSRLGTQAKSLKLINCVEIVEGLKKEFSPMNGDINGAITYENLPQVVIDESQLRQVLQNLIGNALKFHGKDPPCVHIAVVKNNNEWIFSVCDNGIGIDPVYSEKIFGMFQRLHNEVEYPGSGIGLAICKKIIESYSGRIWVESVLGKGSTFYFTIPVIE